MVDLTQYVLPFVGTEGLGNVFPGVTRPYGMVKLEPDLVLDQTNAYAGYPPDGEFTGFSMMLLSGTGGVPMYGVASQLPIAGQIINPLDVRVGRAAPDVAEVGYYSARTADDVSVELAATEHAAMYQYTFPGDQSSIVVDLSHKLPSFRGFGLEQKFEGGDMTVSSDGQYEGSATYSNGYNIAPPWKIYFCGLFDKSPTDSKVFKGKTELSNDIESFESRSSIVSDGARIGTVFSFDQTSVTSRVGISFISSNQACDSVQREIPATSTLTDIVNQTKDEWNNNVLSKVTTTETNLTDLQNLYTSLYFMHQLPSNRTGENPGWKSEEPYFDDIFTMWDLFRTSTPLMQVLQPVAHEQLLRSMVDVWRNDGYLPNARSVNYNGPVQGGSNADILLGDAYVKGVRGVVNWKDAFAAMVKDAEVTPPNNFDPRANDSSTKEGRGALPDWLRLGFITPDFSRSVSRGIEYALDDFALYQVALGEANETESAKYWLRSQNWRNFWNPAATSLGFQGFVGPRNRSGFLPHDPLQGGGYWAEPLYQGSAWEYSFNPHHDLAAFVELCGGRDTFISRLLMLFEHQIDPENPEVRMYNPANQVSFTSPYLFHFAARPDLSTSTSRKTAREKFSPTPNGLPGNADSGAMQSCLLWNMIGLFPLPAQTAFLIHSPWFEHLSIDLGSGKTLVINSTGGNKDTSIHVQSLKVNGQEWRRSWLTRNDIFAEGGTMEFELGPNPNNGWFDSEDLPPSPASAASPSNIQVPIETVEVRAPPSGESPAITPQTQEQRDRRRWYPLLSLFILIPVVGLGLYIFWRSRMAIKKYGNFAVRPPR